MRPQIFVPPANHPLHPYADRVFRLRGRPAPFSETMLPGRTLGLVFNLGSPLHGRFADGPAGGLRLTRAAISGVRTKPFMAAPQGELDLVGVSLRIETCRAVLPVALHETTDASVDAAAVLPGAATLCERLHEAGEFGRQADILLQWLVARLRPVRHGEAVRWACRGLRHAPAESGVKRIAHELGISPRHLRRLFQEHVGLSPAGYQRLARFDDAIHRMHRRRRLTDVALAARYFDQPHFNRDFRRFAGMTPRQYKRVMGAVPGHIFSPDVRFVQSRPA